MKHHHHHQSNRPGAKHPRVASPQEIFDITRQTLGGLVPYLSYGVGQLETWMRLRLRENPPEDGPDVRFATRHVTTADADTEAVAVVHAGMLLLAGLKVGIHPEDAGKMVSDTLCHVLGLTKVDGEQPEKS